MPDTRLADEVAASALDGTEVYYALQGGADRKVTGAQIKTLVIGVPNVYTKQQNFGTATLLDAATIAWDVSVAQVARITLGGNRTMAAPTNLVDGGSYILFVLQDASGSRTITWNSVFKWPSAVPPALSTTAGSIDILTFISDGTNLYGVAQQAFG